MVPNRSPTSSNETMTPIITLTDAHSRMLQRDKEGDWGRSAHVAAAATRTAAFSAASLGRIKLRKQTDSSMVTAELAPRLLRLRVTIGSLVCRYRQSTMGRAKRAGACWWRFRRPRHTKILPENSGYREQQEDHLCHRSACSRCG